MGKYLSSYGIIAIIIGGLLAGFVQQQRNIGAQKAVAKVEKNNAKLGKAADAAGARSLDPGARGMLNPRYRSD